MLLEKDMYIIGTYLKHKENYLKLMCMSLAVMLLDVDKYNAVIS